MIDSTFPYFETDSDCGGADLDRIADAAEAWREILLWAVARGNGSKMPRVKPVAVRVMAMAYVIMPQFFDGKPMGTIARSCGVSKTTFSRHVVEFSVRFNFQSRAVRTPEARQSYRTARLNVLRSRSDCR